MTDPTHDDHELAGTVSETSAQLIELLKEGKSADIAREKMAIRYRTVREGVVVVCLIGLVGVLSNKNVEIAASESGVTFQGGSAKPVERLERAKVEEDPEPEEPAPEVEP